MTTPTPLYMREYRARSTPEWMVPDPDEKAGRDKYGWHLVPFDTRHRIANGVRRIRSHPRGMRKLEIEELAHSFGVSSRTARRYADERYPCPGPRCMTNVRGGGLCSWCRKGLAL